MPEHIDAAKRRIRAEVRARRAERAPESRANAAAALAERLAELVRDRGATSVSCYLPLGDEPDTRLFLSWARQNGVEVLLPSARADGLLDWIREEGEGYLTGRFGIAEPLGPALSPFEVERVDLMLIPACAADPNGVRLGWGRGYFDRNLGSMEQRPDVFAVLYDDEVYEQVPREPHDIPVTGVVTPERLLLSPAVG